MNYSVEVDGNGFRPVVPGNIFDSSEGPVNAGVAHEHVQPTEPAAGFGDDTIDVRGLGHVSFDSQHTLARPCTGGLKVGHCLLQRATITRHYHDIRAALDQLLSDRFAKTSAAARHQRDASVKLHWTCQTSADRHVGK